VKRAAILLALAGGAAVAALGMEAAAVDGHVVELTPAPFAAVEVIGTVTNSSVREASGLAPSRIHDDVLWLLNDGGNPPVLYAVTTGGVSVCDLPIAGAKNVDWEDMASFERDGVPYLLIADVGDNGSKRTNCALRVVAEPDVRDPGFTPGRAAPVAWSVPFVYEDGPRDCEAVAVDVANGQALLLSKRTQPPVLYTLPLDPPVPGAAAAVARRVAAIDTIPMPTAQELGMPGGAYRSQPTAMDISADGVALAVLTYKNAYYYRRLPGQPWPEALKRPPLPVILPDAEDARLRGREALCFTATGADLLVTREGWRPPLCLLRAEPRR
jgi:hypothetical protein